MKRFGVALALALAVLGTALPAAAASFVQDNAGMFSAGTVAQLNDRIGNFNAQTGKEIVVVTTPSLNGVAVSDAARNVFSQQHINGVLVFIAKDDRKDIIVPGTATAQFFPADTTRTIRQSMEAQFRSEDFDGGITSAVGQILDIFRAHMGNANNVSTGNGYTRTYAPAGYARHSSGVQFPMFLWIIILIVGFLIVRSIFRSMAGPRYYGGGGPGPGYGGGPGYGYGGPGYYGGGGGGFWSGLLGGLGGAWIGNELFGNRGTTIVEDGSAPGSAVQGDQGGGWGGNSGGGWGNDAGQADLGASSSGDWSGGGFGGGGDFGGGGGGGGDSGGGW